MGEWTIRRLTPADAGALSTFSAAQGRRHRESEWRLLLDLGGDGCFGAVMDGAIVGTAVTVMHGAALAWVGAMFVASAHRRQGIGAALLEACLDYAGAARVMLDASPMGQPLYERFGFRPLYRVQCWEGQATEFFGRRARRLEAQDMGAVIAFDETRFGAPRGAVLLRLQAEFRRLCWVDRSPQGEIYGYLMARHESGMVVIGPWLHDSPWGAMTLFNTALGAVRGETVQVYVPDCNPAATPIVQDRTLHVVDHTTRMILGEAEPPQSAVEAIFGVASPALG